jgi:hypothetical protein
MPHGFAANDIDKAPTTYGFPVNAGVVETMKKFAGQVG